MRTCGAFLFVLTLVAAPAVDAQGPRGATRLSASAITDSQSVLAELDRHVRAQPRDAAAWYRLGMVAWALFDRARAEDRPRGLDPTKFGRISDTSLRIASELEPRNVPYRLMLGRYLLATNVATARRAANGVFESALAVARTQDSAQLRAHAALEYGRVFWRRYDAFANRRMVTGIGDIGRSLSDAMQPIARNAALYEKMLVDQAVDDAVQSATQRVGFQSARNNIASGTDGGAAGTQAAAAVAARSEAIAATRASVVNDGGSYKTYDNLPSAPLKSIRDLIETQSMALPPDVAGGTDFARADPLFREAYAADPAFPGVFRAVAMTLAEKNRWPDLEVFARAHTALHPKDGPAWMAVALSLHRMGRPSALAVFDTALAHMNSSDRLRLDDISRVLAPWRAERVRDRPDREGFAAMYWMVSNPLWSSNTDVTRAEFLARVAFAELRWTVEEFDLDGADTDRGDIHIRYGPPDLIAVFGPNVTESAADIMTFWMYRSGLIFAFSGMPGFATARIPFADEGMVRAIRSAQPARYDNVVIAKPDTMLVQVARFRAPNEMIDVYVAAAPPVERIRDTTTAGKVRADLWFIGANTETAYRDSIQLDSPGMRTWIPRIAPGQYLFRIEATGAGSTRSARASRMVDADKDFSTSGAGVSDVLVVARAEGPASAARWRDYTLTPLVGVVPVRGQLALVWENYEFASRDGNAEYTVTVTLKRDRTAAGKIAAQVVGTLAGLVRTQSTADQTVFRLDRAVPHSAIVPDNLTIGLADSPAGSYILTLEVEDRVSARTFVRTVSLTVR